MRFVGLQGFVLQSPLWRQPGPTRLLALPCHAWYTALFPSLPLCTVYSQLPGDTASLHAGAALYLLCLAGAAEPGNARGCCTLPAATPDLNLPAEAGSWPSATHRFQGKPTLVEKWGIIPLSFTSAFPTYGSNEPVGISTDFLFWVCPKNAPPWRYSRKSTPQGLFPVKPAMDDCSFLACSCGLSRLPPVQHVPPLRFWPLRRLAPSNCCQQFAAGPQHGVQLISAKTS